MFLAERVPHRAELGGLARIFGGGDLLLNGLSRLPNAIL
jgi:hypothetical protein